MTTAIRSAEKANPDQSAPIGSTFRRSRVGAYWTLYLLTLRQHLHGKRWMAAALLFVLPVGLATLIRLTRSGVPDLMLEFVLLWILVPQALLPLVALLYSSGIVQDEQEEQTITYLLIRPISKSVLYGIKMAATWTTTVLLTIVLTVMTYAAIYAGSETDLNVWLLRCMKAAAILSLAAIAYCSIFGAISLLTRRVLIVGILYTAIVEGLLASFPLSLRWGTVIYYMRLMAYRTMDFVVSWPNERKEDVAATAWFLNIDSDPTLAEHPTLSTCVLTLLCVSLVCTALAAWLCSRREFHVKTPEKE